MKILAVQGSPRPTVSNTEKLLREFLRGAESQGAITEVVYLREKNIHWCQGCYTCWVTTPGVCVFKDDMPELLEKVRTCDVIVVATPLYNYNVTALMKAFQERLLPLLDPHLVKEGDRHRHPTRHGRQRQMVLVSTCGLPEVSHFDCLRQLFRQLGHSDDTSLAGEILMPGGELLKQEALKSKTQPVLDAAYRAGVELVLNNRVSVETESLIQRPVMNPDEMASMTNIFWDSYLDHITTGTPLHPRKIQDIRVVLAGMAATFKAEAAGSLKAVIQFNVTGAQPGDWFLSIENGVCRLNEGQASSPTLTIITSSEIWLAVANRELDRTEGLLRGKIHRSRRFGSAHAHGRPFRDVRRKPLSHRFARRRGETVKVRIFVSSTRFCSILSIMRFMSLAASFLRSSTGLPSP